MAWEYTSVQVIADFGVSHFIEKSGVNVPAGYEPTIPDLWAGNSIEIQVDCYEEYSANESDALKCEFGAVATTKLWLKRKDSDEDPVDLTTGIVTNDGSGRYFRLIYEVPADTIGHIFANEDCILYGVTLDTSRERTWAQHLKILDDSGTGVATKETKDIDVSMIEITGNVTLTEYPGLVVYRITANADITLGSVAAYDPQMMTFILADASLTANLIGTINGDAGGLALTEEFQSCMILGDGLEWINLNLNVYIH